MNKAMLMELSQLRRELHQNPEIAGEEKDTAKRIIDFFKGHNSHQVITNIGGHGLAIIYKGKEPGPTTLIRCELDGLPIEEDHDLKYKSKIHGKSHTCGHDGHMAIVSGLGPHLSKHPIKRGKVVLLYQPAEETGEGANLIINDPKFKKIKPDFAFALHNLPGYPLNEIIMKKDAFAAASKGMIIKLKGRTSHAAHPEAGNSPAEAMSKIIVALQAFPKSMDSFALVTVVHAVLGEIAFGTTPGKVTIRATLRSYDDKTMESLTQFSEKIAKIIAKEYKLGISIKYTECFDSIVNDEKAWEYANKAAKTLGLKIKHIRHPFRWSEDFGHFSSHTKTLLFGIGAGKKQPQLHEPNYDFPDEIIPTGVQMFTQIIAQLNG